MKTVILMILLSSSTMLFAQEETLTNESVLDMIEFGFSEDVIVAKIQASKTDFTTTIESIKELKNKGVSDTLLKTMINGNRKNIQSDRELSQVESRTGIYTKINSELTKILPTVFSGTKTNTLATAFTYGIADATVKSTLNGNTSRNIIPYIKPEFIFYFANSSNNAFSIDTSNWWFISVTSPNEFSLVKLTPTGKKRELQTGKVNIYAGTNIGVDENSVIKFDITQINDYTFKVNPKNALEPGEYCFIYQGMIPSGGINQSVFDFSISANPIKNKYMVGDTIYVSSGNQIRSYTIRAVKSDNGKVCYDVRNKFGIDFYNIKEVDCYRTKDDLKADRYLGSIDGVECSILQRYGKDIVISTSKELSSDQIKKAQELFSLKGKIMFNLDGKKDKGESYAGIYGDYIILYKENVFIKL